MESQIHSTFIPRDTVTGGSGRARSSGGGMYDLFALLSIVLFVASATLAVGVFLYVQYLTTANRSKVEQLERAKAAFEPALIQELTRLDDRMRTADTILSNHIAPSALFNLLEQLTLQTVSFDSFDLNVGGTNLGGSEEIRLTMKGLAGSVNAIALQADYLSKSGAITSPVFSNINRQRGGIQFDLAAQVNPGAMRYREALFNSGSSANPAQQQQGQTQGQLQQSAPVDASIFGVPSDPAEEIQSNNL